MSGGQEVRRKVAEGFCAVCPHRKNMKTKKYCSKCKRAIYNNILSFFVKNVLKIMNKIQFLDLANT